MADYDDQHMTDLHDTMMGQIRENTTMATTESEWEDNVCQSFIMLGVPEVFRDMNRSDDEMATDITGWFESWLETIGKDSTSAYIYKLELIDTTTDPDCEDEYIQFEYEITRKPKRKILLRNLDGTTTTIYKMMAA